MADITLKDLVNTIDPQIKSILNYNFRELDLNKRPHVLDISYQSLLVNNKSNNINNFDELYKVFIDVVRQKAVRKYSSIEDIPRTHFIGTTPYLVYVDGGPTTQLLMAVSFKAIQTFIGEVVRDPNLIDTAFGIKKTQTPKKDSKNRILPDEYDVKEVSRLDIGHIPTADSPFFVSPLEQKVASVLEKFDFMGVDPTSPVYQLAQNSLKKITNIQVNINYEFRNTTPEVFQKVENLFGKMFVAVTIQTADINQKDFGAKELQVFSEFQEKLAIFMADKKLVSKYLGISGSNTILQDIEQGLISIIKTGNAKLTKHQPQKVKPPKVTLANNTKIPRSNVITAEIRNPSSGKPIEEDSLNLVNLKMLLDLHLQDVVSANMGSGTRKDILNYRTGRFASSVTVERLTMGRQGMITAYYNYMKNPYATFSEGGKQSKPASRDPKLLIAKSIREVVAEKVAARLRAVVV